MNEQTHARVHANTRARKHARTQTRTHANTRERTRERTSERMGECTRERTHARTHARANARASVWKMDRQMDTPVIAIDIVFIGINAVIIIGDFYVISISIWKWFHMTSSSVGYPIPNIWTTHYAPYDLRDYVIIRVTRPRLSED